MLLKSDPKNQLKLQVEFLLSAEQRGIVGTDMKEKAISFIAKELEHRYVYIYCAYDHIAKDFAREAGIRQFNRIRPEYPVKHPKGDSSVVILTGLIRTQAQLAHYACFLDHVNNRYNLDVWKIHDWR